MKQWYAICTTPHKEQAVQSLLQARDMETYLPLTKPTRQRKGRRAFKPFFPRYLFVRVDITDVGLSALNWIAAVVSLVSFGGLPTVVPAGAIDIRQHPDDGESPISIEGEWVIGDWRQLGKTLEYVGVEVRAEQVGTAEVVVRTQPDCADFRVARCGLQRVDEQGADSRTLSRGINDEWVEFPGMRRVANPANPTHDGVTRYGGETTTVGFR